MMKGAAPDLADFAVALVMGVGMCGVGYWIFRRHEGGFVSEL
jgi:ABC-type polysaccharide/polyol phosphate export permease